MHCGLDLCDVKRSKVTLCALAPDHVRLSTPFGSRHRSGAGRRRRRSLLFSPPFTTIQYSTTTTVLSLKSGTLFGRPVSPWRRGPHTEPHSIRKRCAQVTFQGDLLFPLHFLSLFLSCGGFNSYSRRWDVAVCCATYFQSLSAWWWIHFNLFPDDPSSVRFK